MIEITNIKNLSVCALAIALCNPVSAQKNDLVAGRDLSTWVSYLDSENATKRLRAARTLATFGAKALPELKAMLSHPDASARYWAASHLGDLGATAISASSALEHTLNDSSFGVKLAAAYALTRVRESQDTLHILADGLCSGERGTACSAADFIARIGPIATPLIPVLEETYLNDADYHVRGASKNALRFVQEDFSLENHARPVTGGEPREWWPGTQEMAPKPRDETSADKRPNILWISVEDISPNLGCYGDTYASTPNLDQLADEGVRFTRAYTPAGVCAVTRTGIITGMYPISYGGQHMRSRIVTPPDVKAFSEYLRAEGYFTSNKFKTDYQFESPLSAWDRQGTEHNDWRDRESGQPFFSVINLDVCHESQIRHSDEVHAQILARLQPEQRHDPERAGEFLPPIYANTPETRTDWARYADNISEMDRQVGKILQRLEDDGLADNTIVVFWSDHGRGLPRGKRWIYESGIHVPLIARWPGVIEQGSVVDDLVSTQDLAPTTLALAGIQPKDYMHGRVFLGPETEAAPEMLFFHRDRMDEAQECMRAASDGRYKYIRNYETQRAYSQHLDYMDQMPTLVDLRRLHAEGKLNEAQSRFFSPTKSAEELYDIIKDPHEINNLAGKADYAEILQKLRLATERWQDRIGDMGMMPEPVMMEFIRPGNVFRATAAPDYKTTGNEIILTCDTPGASINYRINEGPWQLYHTPIDLIPNAKLEIIANRIGYQDSEVIAVAIN
ncbi:MAG: sulfatase-like hydrolase/transferase [Opitutales bacterium]